MVIAPVRVPAAVGVNFTLIAQCLPAASVAPQVVVSEKSPLATMLVMLSVAVPEFVSVIDFAKLVVLSARLGKVRLVGDKLTAGAVPDDAPVPVRLTVCGLPLALSVTLIVPVWVPVAVGVNVTLIVHLPPAATEEPHVLVSAYSALATMLLIVREAVPELVSVMACAALVVFRF